MCPPGLGFVFFNDKAVEARQRLKHVSMYWDWTQRIAPEAFYQYFGGTAPTHHIYGLRAALDAIHAEGLDAIWDRHATLARAIWAACEHWGQDRPLKLNVPDPALRSHAVTALSIEQSAGNKAAPLVFARSRRDAGHRSGHGVRGRSEKRWILPFRAYGPCQRAHMKFSGSWARSRPGLARWTFRIARAASPKRQR